MIIFKSIAVAFSMFSKIPMPRFKWKDEDMKYMLAFFPWVGAVIGICLYIWLLLAEKFGIGSLMYTLIGVAIPILISGGFHIDGFMDTMDALCSYQPRERKLEILKDSHIGAFAVIMLALIGLIYTAAFSNISSVRLIITICAGFFLSRTLSGIASVSFKKARTNGMLYTSVEYSSVRNVKIALYIQLVLCVAFMIYISRLFGLIIVAAAFLTLLYYYGKSKKEFGGITGDLAGFFVVISETVMMVVAAILQLVINNIC